jgi:hypothetical protein
MVGILWALETAIHHEYTLVKFILLSHFVIVS